METAISLRLPEDLKNRLERLSKRTGRSKSHYMVEAIGEKLQELEDLYLARNVGLPTMMVEAGHLLSKRWKSGMAWRIEYDAGAEKDLSKLDPPIAKRIVQFLGQPVAKLDDPRSLGEARKGSKLGEFWKYRIGDDRVIVDLQDQQLVVYALQIGNSREIYR